MYCRCKCRKWQTEDWNKKCEQEDARIKVVYLEKNTGISGNTNSALALATGEFVGLLDHDDIVEPDLLYEVVRCLQDRSWLIVYRWGQGGW